MRSLGRGKFTALSALAVVVAFAALAYAGNLGRNPANKPKLIDEPIESLEYDSASRCQKGERPGAKALARWLDTHTRGELWGIYRCEKWGRNSASVHSEGRAIDWRLDAGRPKEKRAAMHLIEVLTEADRNGEPFALARRMGVQGLIFNCKSWYGGELGPYSRCYKPNGKPDEDVDRTTAHKDHVHIELNWAGARKKTSFWKSKYAPRSAPVQRLGAVAADEAEPRDQGT
jgi:hypothetical protein